MKNQRKFKTLFKRLISGVSALALSVGLLGSIPASADDSNVGYKYTIFAYSSDDGAISSSAANFCVNGNIATNGTISAGQNFNVNGEKKEHANEVMPDLSKAINEKFFAENVDVKAENYKNEDVNINVLAPLDVKGKAEFKGNIKLAAGVKAMGDISFAGGVLNNDNTVLFSEKGNIVINSENVSLTGLVYAPKGNIVIESKSLNLNSVVMIANKITLNSSNININNSASMAKFVQESIDKNGGSNGNDEPEPEEDPAIYAYGEYNEETKSVDIEWYSNVTGEFAVLESMNGTDYTVVSKVSDDTKYSIKVASDFIKKFYKVTIIKDGKTIESIPFSIVNANGTYSTELLDTDKDGLADLYEEMLSTDKTLPDTDKDGLTDYEEAYITNTDPTKYDSVTEGVSDADADNDKDGLTNKKEIEIKTDPNSDDTDGDTLKDGDEVNKYNTDPLKKDTDGDDLEDDDEFKFNCDPNKKDTDNNGIIDGKEKHKQTVDVVPDNKEQAVTKVSVSMSASGNIEKTTTVESIMDKDVLCSSVVGLVGEPFSIESESSFDKATITFTVDKTKLGETEFDNLMFLWYDRENDNFVELETSHDAANSTVSVETTHFSYYLIVDSKQWWDNWKEIESDWKKHTQSTSSTVHVVSPTATILFSHCSDASDPSFLNPDEYSSTIQHYTNYRTLITEHLIDSLSALDIMDIFRSHHEKPFSMFGHACFSNDKKQLKKDLYYYLSDPYTGNDITEEIVFSLEGFSSSVRTENIDNKRTVVITDRDLYVSDSELQWYSQRYLKAESSNDYYQLYKSIPVYFVCIGDFDKTNLEKIASETGGKVYKVATLNELYSELGEKNHVSNVQDYDKDGFSDMEETYGLIVDSSGTRYKTNPYKKDTDDDGLYDNVEISKDGWCEKEGTDHFGNTVWKRYYSINSDPTKQDSDGDDLLDQNDPVPLSVKNYSSYTIEVNNVVFQEEVALLQECLEYLGYLNMGGNDYGKFGGLTNAATQLYQLNHRLYSRGESIETTTIKVMNNNYDFCKVDRTTYYAIIRDAVSKGLKPKYGTNVINKVDSYLNKDFTPKSIQPREINVSNNTSNPVIIKPVKSNRGNSGFFNEDIYVYDLTVPLEGMLRLGAQKFHLHYCSCNVGSSYMEQQIGFNFMKYDNSSNMCRVNNNNCVWLISQVANGKRFDIKVPECWDAFFKELNLTVPFYQSSFPFVFRGEEINAEMFGNILYGFSAHAGGFSKSELVWGGAIYSLISDYRFESPEDSDNIKKGFDMFSNVERDYDYIHIRG